MKLKNTHRCKVCDTPYNSCDLCEQVKIYTPWRALCDTQQHYQVYMIISMIRGGVMNKFEAKESLLHIGVTLDEIKTFIPAVQEVLLPIMEDVTETVTENETVDELEDFTEKKSKRK